MRKFQRLTVVEMFSNPGKGRTALCVCECGTRKIFDLGNLRSGRTRSCGCLNAEARKSRKTHGLSKTQIYLVWNSMVMRCANPKSIMFHKYGARGVTVCERWRVFDNFLADMGHRPGAGYTIDRKDNSKGYEPGNCRWATMKTQQRNRTNNHIIEFQGRSLPLNEMCEMHGIPRERFTARINNGWPVDLAITAPKNSRLSLLQ